jgi:peptidoglycan/xylan/chitin deacetylase (PgdA/CDA1 family)
MKSWKNLPKRIAYQLLKRSKPLTEAEVIPVLCYHAIDDHRVPTSTAPAKFRRQINLLKAKGYNTVSIKSILDKLKSGATISPNPVVIMFDDGFKSVYTTAQPILAEAGYTGSVAVVTDLCAGKIGTSALGGDVPPSEILAFTDLRHMAELGVEICSHSVSHSSLIRLNQQQAWLELSGSKDALEDALGQRVDVFVYPFGEYSEGVIRLAERAGYEGACTIDAGNVRPGDNIFKLRRTCIRWDTPDALFEASLTPAFNYYASASGFLSRRRTITKS